MSWDNWEGFANKKDLDAYIEEEDIDTYTRRATKGLTIIALSAIATFSGLWWIGHVNKKYHEQQSIQKTGALYQEVHNDLEKISTKYISAEKNGKLADILPMLIKTVEWRQKEANKHTVLEEREKVEKIEKNRKSYVKSLMQCINSYVVYHRYTRLSSYNETFEARAEKAKKDFLAHGKIVQDLYKQGGELERMQYELCTLSLILRIAKGGYFNNLAKDKESNKLIKEGILLDTEAEHKKALNKLWELKGVSIIGGVYKKSL